MKSVYDLLSHIVAIIPCNDVTTHELDKKLELCRKELLQSTSKKKKVNDVIKKCNDCGSTNLRPVGWGDTLICNRCGDDQENPRCSQVVLRISNTDREDILTALRLWEEKHNRKNLSGVKKLIKYVDNAGGEHE